MLAAMFERDAAREVGLLELYDDVVIASESYDGDPAPLRRCCDCQCREGRNSVVDSRARSDPNWRQRSVVIVASC